MAREAIFIGYRRDDTADVAGRIYDAMALRFGRERIFKDVDNIGPGVDFGDYIQTVLPRCRVALVLIGPNWIDSKDESGSRRIDDDHDWVRIEIETALASPGLLVVPVLVNGARMPRGEEVPESLRPLLRRNAAIIRRDPDFHDDVERLAAALRASVNTGVLDLSKIGGKESGAAPRSRGASRVPLMTLVAAALAVLAVAFGVLRLLPQLGAQTTEVHEPADEQASAPAQSTQAFLNEVRSRPGVEAMPSGLLIERRMRGTDQLLPRPTASATVLVHYEIRLADGSVVDSSFARREPAEFVLTRVVAGFSEAIQQMRPGDEILATLPMELGYGPDGSPPTIPPASPLQFRIVLLRFQEPGRPPVMAPGQ